IEARKRDVVAIVDSPAARFEYPDVQRIFGQPGRELAALDEHGEGNDVTPAGVVGDHQLDVVAALREGKVADIVGAGLKPHRAYRAPVDDRLDRRVAIEREGASAARCDAALRIEQGI